MSQDKTKIANQIVRASVPFTDFIDISEYEKVGNQGNRPIILDDDKSCFIVSEGAFHVFVADSNAGELIGRRNYLFSLFAGDMVFGISPTGGKDKQITLFAIGIDQSQMVKINVSDLPNFLKPGYTSNLRQISDSSFSQDIDEIRSAEEAAESLKIADSDTMGLEKHENAPDIEDMRVKFFTNCIKTWADKFAYVTKTGDADDIIPVSEMDVNLIEYLENGLLTEFNRRVLKRIYRMKKNYSLYQKDRLEKKRQLGQKYMNKTLVGMVGILNKQEVLPEGAEETPLITVCRMVFKSAGIQMTVPPALRLKDTDDPIAEVARSSRVRHRNVTLKEGWYKRDNGPLIAFLKGDNNIPVALLPISSSKYNMYNPIMKTKVMVTKEVADTIDPLVTFLYRPLPSKPVKLMGIIQYGIKAMPIIDIVVFLGLSLLSGWLSRFTPRILNSIIGFIIPSGSRSALIDIVTMFFSLSIGMTMLGLVSSFAYNRIESRVSMMLQAAVWDRLMSLPVPFYSKFNSGELARRASGIESIRSQLTNVFVSSFIAIITGLFQIGEMFRYSPNLAWVGILVAFVNVGLSILFSWYNLRMYGEMLGASYFISGMMYQIINGVAKFRVSGAESRALYQWAKAYTRQTRVGFKISVFTTSYGTFRSIVSTVTNIAFFAVACSGGKIITAANWMSFWVAYGYVSGAIGSISNIVTTMIQNIPVFKNSKPILETLPEYDEAKMDPGKITGEIEVSHLNFRYRQDGPLILNDVSLKVKRGEYIAIVGASGSGKTTLLRMLLGFEKPQSGKIYYNGQDLDGIDLRAVRRQLGVVLQSGQLMTGDIFSNIIGANTRLTMPEAENAAKVAGLYDDIAKMPMGMYTLVSEGGGTLSGGQRQRLLIARAVVNRPSILYFDEATSALDNKTQAEVIRNLDALNATRIVVAHRLSTVINCDRIVVMNKGKIVEEGNFKQLMARNGLFAELAKRQMA